MIEFGCFLLVFGFLVLFIKRVSAANICTEQIINIEQFADTTSVISHLPKRNIKDSHWFIKTFLRPRRRVIR